MRLSHRRAGKGLVAGAVNLALALALGGVPFRRRGDRAGGPRRAGRLRHQPGAVHPRAARSRRGHAPGRIFRWHPSTARRSPCGCSRERRARVLGGGRADGSRRVAAHSPSGTSTSTRTSPRRTRNEHMHDEHHRHEHERRLGRPRTPQPYPPARTANPPPSALPRPAPPSPH